MRDAIHEFATATAFRLKAEATLTLRGIRGFRLQPEGSS
jgi:hypothetical protein